MVQQRIDPQEPPTDFDHHVVLFPTRYAAYVPTESPAELANHSGFGVLPTADGGKIIWALR